MDFSEINIHDKALFDRYLKLYNAQASEFTFTNFFMWRDLYRFRYTEVNDLLCVIAVPDQGRPYAMMPVGRINPDNFVKAVEVLKTYFRKNGWDLWFHKIPEDGLDFFKNIMQTDGRIIFDRDNCDYVYLTQELIHLPGKKFHAKRNHINKFNRLHQFEYVPLNEDLADECIRIMRDWCEARNCECWRGKYCERLANMEVLNNYNLLDCRGALIKVDGRFEAFTVGEMLNTDTAVIHIEKASFGIDGLYALINQQFCEKEWNGTTYINREQDLGQEGLRKAKLSYNPVRMVNKYSVYI